MTIAITIGIVYTIILISFVIAQDINTSTPDYFAFIYLGAGAITMIVSAWLDYYLTGVLIWYIPVAFGIMATGGVYSFLILINYMTAMRGRCEELLVDISSRVADRHRGILEIVRSPKSHNRYYLLVFGKNSNTPIGRFEISRKKYWNIHYAGKAVVKFNWGIFNWRVSRVFPANTAK